MVADALKGTCFPSISIFRIILIIQSLLYCLRRLRCRLRLRCDIALRRRHIYRLVPISIGGGIRGISGLCFQHTISKWHRLQRQLLRLYFLGILIRFSFDTGTGSGAVIQHMTNVLLVAIKLEQERKCCKLHLGVFNQHSLGI